MTTGATIANDMGGSSAGIRARVSHCLRQSLGSSRALLLLSCP